MTTTERLCIDCDRRPTPKDGSRERCYPCQQTWGNELRDQELEKAERKTKRRWEDPLNTCRYCTVYLWRHHLVGLTTGVTENGRVYCTMGFYYLEPGPTQETLDKFGKRLRDMNVFQPGFDREWVKRFKAMVLAVERPAAGQRLNWDGSL